MGAFTAATINSCDAPHATDAITAPDLGHHQVNADASRVDFDFNDMADSYVPPAYCPVLGSGETTIPQKDQDGLLGLLGQLGHAAPDKHEMNVDRKAAQAIIINSTTSSTVSWIGAHYKLGKFTATWSGSDIKQMRLRITHTSAPNNIVWESDTGKSFVGAARGKTKITGHLGSYWIYDDRDREYLTQQIDNIDYRSASSADEAALVIEGILIDPDHAEAFKPNYQITFKSLKPNQLSFSIKLSSEVKNADQDRIIFTYASDENEKFLGFGEQYSYLDLKGKKVQILTSEQGIGRGRQPITFAMNKASGAGGGYWTTYAPVPFYMTNKRHSLFLENTEISYFDLSRKESVQITLLGSELHGRILAGSNPADFLYELTDYAGRMKPLPNWSQTGAVIGLQGGTQKVRSAQKKLTQANAAVAAFWLQDWVGKRVTNLGSFLWWNWELDKNHYTDWHQLIDELKAQGTRVMTYFNPFLVDISHRVDKSGKPTYQRNLLKEAYEQGLLVRGKDGCALTFPFIQWETTLLDLSNPKARRWIKDIMIDHLLNSGVSGWMGDYAEAMPFESEISLSGGAAAYHNQYPVEWAKIQREAVEEAGLADDVIVFTRGGFTQTPRYSSLVFTGDHLTTWDEHDGMKSAITGLLSSALSGYSLNHADIGGYHAIVAPGIDASLYKRSKELFMRWTEWNTFTAMMRTHEGNQPDKNHQFDSDNETLTHFARFSRLFAALAPYRKQLMLQAQEQGLPLMRPLFLHYPDDEHVFDKPYQFLLGQDLLIAPIVEKGDSSVRIYLPKGKWRHVWTQKVYSGPSQKNLLGQYPQIQAPIGYPAIFVRIDSPNEKLLTGIFETF